jgi:hypothetical protein
LAPYACLILTIVLVILSIARLYVFEQTIPRLYPQTWSRLDDTQRRNFINHHVAVIIKLSLVVSQSYPFFAVAFGKSTLHTTLTPGGSVTTGDIMVVGSQVFVAMYIFELYYRVRVSHISMAHHIGAILITQAAITIGLNFTHEKDATIEFVLCFLWGELLHSGGVIFISAVYIN